MVVVVVVVVVAMAVVEWVLWLVCCVRMVCKVKRWIGRGGLVFAGLLVGWLANWFRRAGRCRTVAGPGMT